MLEILKWFKKKRVTPERVDLLEYKIQLLKDYLAIYKIDAGIRVNDLELRVAALEAIHRGRKSFADVVREMQGDRTQRALGEEWGMSEVAICNYVRGENLPFRSTMEKIAEKINITKEHPLWEAWERENKEKYADRKAKSATRSSGSL